MSSNKFSIYQICFRLFLPIAACGFAVASVVASNKMPKEFIWMYPIILAFFASIPPFVYPQILQGKLRSLLSGLAVGLLIGPLAVFMTYTAKFFFQNHLEWTFDNVITSKGTVLINYLVASAILGSQLIVAIFYFLIGNMNAARR
jgi:hypothetical protein